MWNKAEGTDHRKQMEIGGALVLLLTTIVCTPGGEADPCQHSVKASRRTLTITEGTTAVMQCDVEHCGEDHWKGGWGRVIEPFVFLQPTPRHILYNSNLSANSVRLFLEILNSNLSDAGLYQCRVNMNSIVLNGHVTTLNITAAVAGGTARSRVAVYVGVCICILLILVLPCLLGPTCRRCCCPRKLLEEQPPGVTGVRSPLPHSSGAKLTHVFTKRVIEVGSWPRTLTRDAVFGASSAD